MAEEQVAPGSNAQYKAQAYWDSRFEKESAYEWLGTLRDFAPQLSAALADLCGRPARVLVVGCGNSRLSADLQAREPLWDIVSVDYSKVVVENMRLAYPHLTFLVDDMTMLRSSEAGSFDAVIDKAAMDALVTDEGDPWNPSESSKTSVDAMMASVARVLKRAGVLFQISFQQPHFRRKHLERGMANSLVAWSPVQTLTAADVGMGYFCFFATKLGE
jgi:SAM-dependent methyltransferase